MKHKIFTIYDEKAQTFIPIFVLPEIGMALRTFVDCVNDPNHAFGKHPADYTIFTLGTFNDQNGDIEFNPPKSLGNGVEFVKPPEPDLFDAPKISDDTPVQPGTPS